MQQGASAVATAGAQGGPFDGVKDMISTLITSLKDQANSEANQHQFCQEGLAQNRRDRTSKLNEIDGKASELRRAQLAGKRLSAEVAFVESEVTRLKVGAETEDTQLRDETKRLDKQMEQHKLASNIVGQTISVLRQLCGLESSGAQLLQLQEASKRGSQCSEAVDLLSQAQQKFKDQNVVAKAYLDQYTELAGSAKSAMEAAARERDLELSQGRASLASREEAAARAKSDLKAAKADLELIVTGAEDIAKSCGPGVETPEQRMKRRQEEIDALKNALSVLEGEAVPVTSLVQAQPIAEHGPLETAAAQLGLSSPDA